MSRTLKTVDSRLQLVLMLGGKCEKCGYETEPKILRITKRDGSKETTKGGGAQWYARLIKIQNNPKDYKVVCPTCLALGQLAVDQTVIWNASTLPISVIARSKEFKDLVGKYGTDLFVVTEGRVFNSILIDIGDGLEFLKLFVDVPEGISVHISHS